MRSTVVRLHEDGSLAIICLMAMVLIGGIYSMYRASQQTALVREMRLEISRFDEAFRRREGLVDTLAAQQIEIMKSQQAILKALERSHAVRP